MRCNTSSLYRHTSPINTSTNHSLNLQHAAISFTRSCIGNEYLNALPGPSNLMILHCPMELVTHQRTIIFISHPPHCDLPITRRYRYFQSPKSMTATIATKRPQHHVVGWLKYLHSMAAHTTLQDSRHHNWSVKIQKNPGSSAREAFQQPSPLQCTLPRAFKTGDLAMSCGITTRWLNILSTTPSLTTFHFPNDTKISIFSKPGVDDFSNCHQNVLTQWCRVAR